MFIVDTAVLHPGVCAATNTCNGPFIDTEHENDAGERIYLSTAWVREAGSLVDLVPAENLAAAEETIASQEKELEDLREVEDELKRLKNAVERTLYQGAVVKREKQEDSFKLRPKPGEKAVSLSD